MQISDFDFHLPQELIARYPLAERSASRLMRVNAREPDVSHATFKDILNWVNPGDLMVFNNTKVIPARFWGQKLTGGKAEMLLERVLSEHSCLAQLRVSKPPKIGDPILLSNGMRLIVSGRKEHFYELTLEQPCQLSIIQVIEAIGQIPLPPYMHRAAEESDKERYQTVYAAHQGSVAAPTAGLHFDQALLNQLAERGITMAHVMLHIGAGTFAPIRVDNIAEHRMHAEYLDVPASVCEQIRATKAHGGRVIAVGTTTLRALETAMQSGEIIPFQGDTSIFITPGHCFRSADVLITNLHLPQSTLMMLVCAFGGHQTLMNAYDVAIKQAYRFYSYGDAMWIDRFVDCS